MPRIANFAALPQSVKAFEPALLRTVTGRILGFAADQSTGDPVVGRVVRAAMLSCFCYAPVAPDEVLLEASARLAGWLLGTRPHAKSTVSLDPSGTRLDMEFTNSQATPNGLRASGASALLSPFKVRRAIGGPPVPTRARPPAREAGTTVMRFAWTDTLPYRDSFFRWAGTVNGVELSTTWGMPASFAFWIPGNLMDRVVGFVAIEFPTGVTVNLGDFGPAEPYRFGDTLGMIRFTPVSFSGSFVIPNTYRAVLGV